MNLGAAVFLVVLLGSSLYAAGRLHARIGYRFGFRSGYRQGYVDGDRACWNRRRRSDRNGSAGRTPESAEPGAACAATAVIPLLDDRVSRDDDRVSKDIAVIGTPNGARIGPSAHSLSSGYGAFALMRAGTTYSSASALGRHAQLD